MVGVELTADWAHLDLWPLSGKSGSQGRPLRRLSGAALALQRRRGRLLWTDRDRRRGYVEQDEETLRHMEGLCDRGVLMMSCILPPSSYFTMAFRELTRHETIWTGFTQEEMEKAPLFWKQVDTQFGQISPQDMATLQLRLAQTEGDARPPMEKVLGQIQKSMEARMEGATKEIEALMQSSGNIADNIRECISRQESLLPMIAVLQMNIARAQKAKNEQLERAEGG
eukprot:g690.t1